MDITTLQVPLPKSLKSNATSVAREIGFSSLQDFVRLVLTKLAHRELTVEVASTEYIKLSPAAKKRYAKMAEDFRKRKNIKEFDNIDDLMKYLNS